MNYLETLNEKQLEAVKHTEGFLRVIAGAGSGKTKLLVSRYAYLVKDCGIDSANILCVTFTNKAAGEMKRRIRAIIGQEYDTSLICTYHGFCVRVLREDIEKIFYPKEFQIIDIAQQKSILSEIYQSFELKLDHGSFEKTLKLIAEKKRDRSYVAKMCDTEKCQILPQIIDLDDQIVEKYLQRQKQVYAMDFNDLMYFTLDIFERCPDVLQKWQDRLNYIQVDEFQDSSCTEMQLIDMLSEKHKNLMIVGDPDQNIYEWRGSDVKLLVDFDKEHRPTSDIILNQNYRSTPGILQCANTLIANNVYRLEKDLFTKNTDNTRVFHYHTKNEYAEADKIIEIIMEIKKQDKCNFSDFAVLYRSGFLSRIIEKKFTENGVPYEIFGGVKFYHRMEIQDIMAYLRLIAFDDDVSLKRIINIPRRRFGRVKLQQLQALQADKSLYETLKENLNNIAFKNSGASDFVRMIENVRSAYRHIPLYETVELVCAESGYEKYIRELGDMERFENLSEFKRIAAEYEKNYGENVSLKDFVNQISLQSEDDLEEDTDMVKLMTIHSAKGLEFPTVFVVGLSEGIFPSAKTIEERKQVGLEEERRLCYVAITRAEKRLYLMDSEGYTQNEKEKIPSRFLAEIGEQNYVRIGKIPKELKSDMEKICRAAKEKPANKELTVGKSVTHPVFGTGKVVGLAKNGNSYVVKFDKLSSERVLSKEFFDEKPKVKTPEPVKEEMSTVPEQSKNNDADDVEEDDYIKCEQQIVPEMVKKQNFEPEEDFGDSNVGESDITEEENGFIRKDLPTEGWVCTGVTDLGAPTGLCRYCERQAIRYVHHMYNPKFGHLGTGCVCAGKLEGDIEKAKRREQDFKNKQIRKENFKKRKWKKSKNNNSYLKIKNHLIVLYYSEKNHNWKYSLDNKFCVEVFSSKSEAIDGAFEALEKKLRE